MFRKHPVRNMKIRNQIMLLFSMVFLFFSLGSGWAYYRLSANNVEENFETGATDSLNQISDTLDSKIQETNTRMRILLTNTTFYDLITRELDQPSEQHLIQLQSYLDDSLKGFERSEPLIASSYLKTEAGAFYSYTHVLKKDFRFTDSPYYRNYLNQDTAAVQWFPPHADQIFAGDREVITCVQRYHMDSIRSDVYFVYQLSCVDMKNFVMGAKPFFDDVVLTDGDGNRILGEKDPEEYRKNQEDWLIVSTSLYDGTWTIYGIKSRSSLLESFRELRLRIAQIAAVVFGICLICIWIISRQMTEAFGRLEKTMLRAQKGDMTARFYYAYDNEIGQLSRSYNFMIDRIQNLVDAQNDMIRQLQEERDRVRDMEKEKRRAELRALEAQIKPHFLYNTLNTIIWQASDQGLDDVSVLASSLGKFFRISLSKGKENIRLSDELEHVRSYLSIQEIRYRDRMQYEIIFDSSLNDCLVPKLILQPLAENAIYHGIREKKSGGKLIIRAERKEQTLHLSVWDNGVGMKKEQRDAINSALRAGERGSSESYGIYNVNERIRLYYGERYGLFYEGEENVYTCAVLTLPVRRDSGEVKRIV